MAQLVKHLKVSGIADGPDPTQVNPSDWNASHVFSGGALGGLLMRDTGDATYGASWIASVAAGSVLISNGVGAAPTWTASLTLGGLLTVASVAVTGNATVGGTLGVTGAVTVNAFGTHNFIGSGVGNQAILIRNLLAGSGNYTTLGVGNDADPTLAILQSYSSTYASAGPSQANGCGLFCFGAGGLSLAALHATGAMRFYSNGVERARILPTGEVLVGATATVGPFPNIMGIAGDGNARQHLVLQNTNVAGNTTTSFLYFVNPSNAGCGSVAQTSATTVAYNTTSDARLKDDAGRAMDLAALAAVVVHDFTWTGDGRRDRGIFAQEAAQVFPRAVTVGSDETTADGTLAHPWMTDYSKFVPDLIVGWQQHEADLAALRAALSAAGLGE
jgi:hypothetical protein